MVVLISRRTADDGLYRELPDMPQRREQAGITALYQIGDCVAPVNLSDAIFIGHGHARDIDSPNPAFALPVRHV